PENPYYNIATAYRLKGDLNTAALERSITHLIARHEILRTEFISEAGVPKQHILPQLDFSLRVEDISAIVEQSLEIRLLKLASEYVRHPFILSQAPLFRITLFRLSEDEYLLLFVCHHIIMDEWSLDLFFHELVAFYNAALSGESPSVPALKHHFIDFAVWYRAWISQSCLPEQMNYWRNKLRHSPPVLEFPTTYPRTSFQSYEGQSLSLHFGDDFLESVTDLCGRERVTPFMFYLTVFVILLYKYSGQNHFLVGTPISNRCLEETTSMLGYFLNTLAIETKISGDKTFRQVLKDISQNCLEAFANQDIPFEEIVRELNPTRSITFSPLFQVMFVYRKVNLAQQQFQGLAHHRQDIRTGTTKFDCTLFIEDAGRTIRGVLEFRKALFSEQYMNSFLNHYQALLKSIISNPEQTMSSLNFLQDTAEQRFLEQWNDTEVNFSDQACLHQLFEAQVKKDPLAVAVEDGDRSLTYRQLNNWSNELAQCLIEIGLGPDETVAVLMKRSLEMMVGILAILKAGGCYLPLDMSLPRDRINFMLQDTKVLAVLTQQNCAILETITYDGEVLFFEAACGGKDGTKEFLDPRTDVKPAHLAYIMYTSGSTGEPKGVEMEHGSLVNLIEWMVRSDWFQAQARTLQFAPAGFDVSCQEMFSTWLSGGVLVIAEQRARLDFEYLLHIIISKSIERLFLPPIALRYLARVTKEDHYDKLGQLKEIYVAGEKLKIVPEIKSFFSHLPHCILQNQYGPMEAHVVTAYTVERPCTQWPTFPPIGEPIANTQIYILDASLQQLPLGVPGELYIGGTCLARGYHDRPELTQSKFLINPFHKNDRCRLYKTGDLARFLADGNIEFLGRQDNQVKVRGYRIELREIELALQKSPLVKENTVLSKVDPQGFNTLVAYIVPVTIDRLNILDLKKFLRETLPLYMVPDFFITLDTLPLTSNGKVDQALLPEPDFSVLSLAAETSFHHDTFQKLIQIWENLLHHSPINITDDFFLSGGYSLLAVRLFEEIQRVFSVKLPVSILYQASTVEKLAALIMDQDAGEGSPLIIPIRVTGDFPPIFFMHHSDGGVLDYRELINHIDERYPIYGIHVKEEKGVPLAYKDIRKAVKFYTEAILSIRKQGPYCLCGHSFGGIVALEVARYLISQGAVVDLLALIDIRAPGFTRTTRSDVTLFLMRSLLEKCRFHLYRLRSMPWGKRRYYLWEKFKVLWAHNSGHSSHKQSHGVSGYSSSHLTIDRISADSGFSTEGYPGKITLFCRAGIDRFCG
ncbi:amino acid adenylation domain-containing protein, partial [candidate division CSSED10-310 bacterium]